MSCSWRNAIALTLVFLLIPQAIHAEDEDGPMLKIMTLRNTAVADMPQIVSALFPDNQLRIAIDERTNSLIARGPSTTLSEIEALLLKLDSSESSERPSTEATTAIPAASPESIVVNNPINGSSTIRFIAKSGTAVKKGDLLVEFDQESVEKELEQIRFQLDQTETSSKVANANPEGAAEITEYELHVRLAKLRLEHGMEEIKLNAQNMVDAITAAKETIEDVTSFAELLSRRKNTTDQVSDKDLLEASVMLREQRQRHSKLERELELFVTKTKPLQIAELESQLVHAKAQLQESRSRFEQAQLERQADVAALTATVELLTDRHRKLELQRASTHQIKSPLDGIVQEIGMPDARLRSGSKVRQGQPLLSIVK